MSKQSVFVLPQTVMVLLLLFLVILCLFCLWILRREKRKLKLLDSSTKRALKSERSNWAACSLANRLNLRWKAKTCWIASVILKHDGTVLLAVCSQNFIGRFSVLWFLVWLKMASLTIFHLGLLLLSLFVLTWPHEGFSLKGIRRSNIQWSVFLRALFTAAFSFSSWLM